MGQFQIQLKQKKKREKRREKFAKLGGNVCHVFPTISQIVVRRRKLRGASKFARIETINVGEWKEAEWKTKKQKKKRKKKTKTEKERTRRVYPVSTFISSSGAFRIDAFRFNACFFPRGIRSRFHALPLLETRRCKMPLSLPGKRIPPMDQGTTSDARSQRTLKSWSSESCGRRATLSISNEVSLLKIILIKKEFIKKFRIQMWKYNWVIVNNNKKYKYQSTIKMKLNDRKF